MAESQRLETNLARRDPEPWHACPVETALERLESDRSGITQAEANRRLAHFGENMLPAAEDASWLRRFFRQFNNPLIFVLLIAGFTTLGLRHWVDAGVILGMILVMALIGTVQEGRAQQALRGIRRMLLHHANARRDGLVISLPARELVPGDVVLLESGDRVPADLRLIEVRGLQIDESTLTGESAAVEKGVAAVAEGEPLAERLCMSYAGTYVTHGRGTGLVVCTGAASEIGRIATLAESVESEQTPLMRRMGDLSRVLSGVIVALATVTFLFGILYRHVPVGEMFVIAVALAVAAIPEGLPAVITITLAIGVQRMASRNSIIRHLPSVETLGAVTVICSDKTGTLTRNEMMVRAVQLRSELLEVTGNGYDPGGELRSEGRVVDSASDPALRRLAQIGALCNDARLTSGDGWNVQGDPTEGALLAMAMKAGLDPGEQSAECPRIDAIPFESEHQFMATLGHDQQGRAWIFVKGAPEPILDRCSHQLDGAETVALERDWWHERVQMFGQQGHRTLALALRETVREQTVLDHADLDQGLVLAGIVGISDPPREEAISAVSLCRGAGIRVKMVTGDLPATASAIARKFSIDTGRTLSGSDIAAMDEHAFSDAADIVDVYARTSPEQKLRLVKALQRNGEVVAMTGDGVNDAPALRQADIGIAMGQRGTEVAREASDMVLTDDNFASIAHAVREGRTVYDNIRKSILFMLPTGLAEAFVIVLATLGGLTLPLTAVQILWVNMITAITLGIALAFEPPEQDVMLRKPRPPGDSAFSGHLGRRVALVSLVMVAGTLWQFVQALESGLSVEAARTITVNTVVFFEVFYLFSSRYLVLPVLTWRGLTGNPYVICMAALMVIFQGLFTYLPLMNHLFKSTGIPLQAWVGILLTSASILLVVEAEKYLLRRRERSGHS